MEKGGKSGNIGYINPIQLGDVNETTVEIIASSGSLHAPSYHRDQLHSVSVGGKNDSVQLVQGVEAGNSGIRSSNAGGVEELQTFLNNFNSELAAESQQATVRLIESSAITTSANASYTIYETTAPATATLVYEDDTLSGNVTNSVTGLQIVEFPNNSTFPQDNSATVGESSHGEVIFLSQSLPQHFQLQQECQNVASTLMNGQLSVNACQDIQMAIRNQQQMPHAENQQQLLIPIDCTNALVNGNQIPPGSTVLLPVIPTVLANGTVEVRIAGQAIALPTSVPVQIASEATVSTTDSRPHIIHQPQQQQIVVIVSSSGNPEDPGLVQETPRKTQVVKPKVAKKQESSPKKAKTVVVSQKRTELQSGMSSLSDKSGDETADDEKEKDDESKASESPKKSKGGAESEDNHKTSASSKRTVFHCEFCDYTNVKKYLLVRHMKSHSEDRPHVCHVCEKRFKANSSLQNHVNTHTGVRPYQCQGCEASFTTSGEMVRHMRYKHTQEKPHKCSHCDYASVELSKLKRHLRSHTGERPYECRKCNYASPDMYKLKRHMRVHTGEKPYECDICLQRFTQSNSLKAHKLIHTGNKPVYQCEFCSSSCGRKTDLKIHIQKLHTTSERPLVCKKCGQSFVDRYTLKQHQRAHEGERLYGCQLCPYSAHTQRHLDVHMLVHQGEKPFECPVQSCLHAFRQKTALKRHIEAKHGGKSETQLLAETSGQEKPPLLQCGQCNKRFRKKEALLKHGEQHRLIDEGISGGNEDGNGPGLTRRGDTAVIQIGFIESENEEESSDEEEMPEPELELDKSSGSIRLYKCNLCDESFRQPVQLEDHCQLEHIGADDSANATSIIYVPNTSVGAATSKSMNYSGESVDDGYDAALALLIRQGPKTGEANRRTKRKLVPKPPDTFKSKRPKGRAPAANRKNAKSTATTSSSIEIPEDPEVQRRREVENCFGFADLDSPENGQGGGQKETAPSTSADGTDTRFESMDALLEQAGFDSGGDDGNEAIPTRRSTRKVKVEKVE